MIDARGFSCPMPVVMVQKELKKSAPAELDVLVDNRDRAGKRDPVRRQSGVSGGQRPGRRRLPSAFT